MNMNGLTNPRVVLPLSVVNASASGSGFLTKLAEDMMPDVCIGITSTAEMATSGPCIVLVDSLLDLNWASLSRHLSHVRGVICMTTPREETKVEKRAIEAVLAPNGAMRFGFVFYPGQVMPDDAHFWLALRNALISVAFRNHLAEMMQRHPHLAGPVSTADPDGSCAC